MSLRRIVYFIVFVALLIGGIYGAILYLQRRRIPGEPTDLTLWTGDVPPPELMDLLPPGQKPLIPLTPGLNCNALVPDCQGSFPKWQAKYRAALNAFARSLKWHCTHVVPKDKTRECIRGYYHACRSLDNWPACLAWLESEGLEAAWPLFHCQVCVQGNPNDRHAATACTSCLQP